MPLRTKKDRTYAFFVPGGAQGISADWERVEKKVKGAPGARYKSFDTRAAAEEWLRRGAVYAPPPPPPPAPRLAPGIYFDAGTGRGTGVEVSVTDEKGKNLLYKAISKSGLNKFGKQLLADQSATNNYGELLALRYAFSIALKDLKNTGRANNRGGASKKIFGDSKLVIEYWSRWRIKRKQLPHATVELAEEVSRLRETFEKKGGVVARISGAHNPADLGFH